MKKIGKLLTAMVTPFDERDEVDFVKAQSLAKDLVDVQGSDGIVVAGTTGESPTISFEEKIELMRTVVKAVGDRAYIVGGTGTNSTKESVRLSQAASDTGIDAVMLVAPYYNKPPQEGLYQHFKTIADSVNKPVILYNVPGRTQSNILPETVNKLSQIENIVAIKEACGNMDQVSLLLSLVGGRMIVLSGDDSATLPMLSVGAQGVISVASHIAGQKIKGMINAFAAGELQKAALMHQELLPLFKVLFITANPIPVKHALSLRGLDVGGVRLPLVAATALEIEKINGVIKDYI
jgi:4-hydroxy-tetrahydrodipicolinate synthase